jgi:hypothetical protein
VQPTNTRSAPLTKPGAGRPSSSSNRLGAKVWHLGVPSRVGMLSHGACSDQPPGGGPRRHPPAFPPAGRRESHSAVSGAGPICDGMHRSRRASSGAPLCI